MDQRNWRWIDAHFCSLPSQTSLVYGITTTPQTNVYGHSKVIEPGRSNKLLIASLAGKLTAVEYERSSKKLKPSTKEIQFIYIPGDAELVSLDVACKSSPGNELMVGITFLKQIQNEEGETVCMKYLNLYSACQPGEEFLENVAKDCVTLELKFMPYQLIHTEIVIEGTLETVFLLSGNDHQVHLYREIQDQNFIEETTNDYFPEFSCSESSIQWMDIVYFDDHKKRLTAQGQKNGQVYVSLVDVRSTEVISGWEVHHNSQITCVKIFNPVNNVPHPSFLETPAGKNIYDIDRPKTTYNVLVLSALEPAVVYRDVLANGLKDQLCLPNSCNYDIPLCACVVDIDFDGENEILIGTYGQEVLAYKLMQKSERVPSPSKQPNRNISVNHSSSSVANDMSQDNLNKHRHLSNETSPTKDPSCLKLPRKSKSQENLSSSVKSGLESSVCLNEFKAIEEISELASSKQCYKILWQRSFASPVMNVDNVDIMGDGMDDLVVVTLRGVHVVQPDLMEVAKVCLERMKSIADGIHEESSPRINEATESDGQFHMKIDDNITHSIPTESSKDQIK